MKFIKEMPVTFIDVDELFLHARNLPINGIERHDVMDRNLVNVSHLLILNKDNQYKVFKSKY